VLSNAALNVNVVWCRIEIIYFVFRSQPNQFLSGRKFVSSAYEER